MKEIVNIIQPNPTVGDIKGNADKIVKGINEGDGYINLSSELSLLGYPPQDLLYREELYAAQSEAIERICHSTPSEQITIVGGVERDNNRLYNTAYVVGRKGVEDKYRKCLLPTYDIFDEARYFTPDNDLTVLEHKGHRVGISICEDAWADVKPQGINQHDTDPMRAYEDENLDMMLNLSASPYRYSKPSSRIERFNRHSRNLGIPIAVANQTGGNDELVFDGGSFVTDNGQITYRTSSFREQLSESPNVGAKTQPLPDVIEAIKMGIKDYFDKTGFEKAIIGMSGGVDSSLTAVLVSEALGSENVFGITLPSSVSSNSSVTDAESVANNLDIKFDTIPINRMFDISEEDISAVGYEIEGLAWENLQARLRGVVLMTISNCVHNSLVITPDNKSEGAVGYCTLYGDTVGAIAPLGDLYKDRVYEIADMYNQEGLLPDSVIDKAPSAELREDQEDADDIPTYDKLDNFLKDYIDEHKPISDISSELTESESNEVVERIHLSEFKRNQSPVTIRVSPKDMSFGWRYPIAADYSFLNEQ